MKSIVFLSVLLVLCAIPMTASAATVTIRPDSQGYYSGWTNSGCGSGSNEWQCVDENPVNTSDLLYSSGNSAKETFKFQNVSLTSETINSLTFYYYAKYYSSTKYKMQPLIRSGGKNYLGDVFSTTSNYTSYSQTYTTNPATNSSWNVSAVNNLEAGMSTYNSNGGSYVAQVYAVVDYTIPDSCSDTDGGNVITTYGTTSGYLNESQYSHSDYCVDSTNVMEYYCSGDYEQSSQQSCGEGKKCSGGACVWNDTCSDTDGGFIVLTQGTISGYYYGSPYSYTDSCNGTVLLENYCIGSNFGWSWYNCQTNVTTTCSNGACV